MKLLPLVRLTITCKLQVRKSRDCATCDIGLYAGPHAQFQLNTLSDGNVNVIPSIILITRSVLFSLKCTRNRLADGLRPDPLGELVFQKHHVSKKSPSFISRSLVKHCLILIIFGRNIPEVYWPEEMVSFPISPNLCS